MKRLDKEVEFVTKYHETVIDKSKALRYSTEPVYPEMSDLTKGSHVAVAVDIMLGGLVAVGFIGLVSCVVSLI